MAAENDFLAFATGGGANVMTQADYAVAAFLATGFEPGLAQSQQLNKVWRQSSYVAAAIATFIVNQTGDNALDDGNLATFVANLTSAIQGSAAIRPAKIITASTAYAILLTDYRIGWLRTAGVAALTATLPAGAVVGQSFKLVDIKGNFNADPVTVAPQAGQNIAGLPGNYVMNVDRMSAEFAYMGSNTWSLEL